MKPCALSSPLLSYPAVGTVASPTVVPWKSRPVHCGGVFPSAVNLTGGRMLYTKKQNQISNKIRIKVKVHAVFFGCEQEISKPPPAPLDGSNNWLNPRRHVHVMDSRTPCVSAMGCREA